MVKTLNTVTASLMVEARQLADGEHHMFLCGNDAEAKAQVGKILKDWFGWRNVLDLGDISQCARDGDVLAAVAALNGGSWEAGI